MIILLICAGTAFAQNPKLMDSLLQKLRVSKEDTNKVNVLFNLSENCEIQDILKYAGPALKLAQKLDYKKGIADATNNVGLYYSSIGRHDIAMKYYTEALKAQEQVGNLQGIASCLSNIALIYKGQGQIEKALDF